MKAGLHQPPPPLPDCSRDSTSLLHHFRPHQNHTHRSNIPRWLQIVSSDRLRRFQALQALSIQYGVFQSIYTSLESKAVPVAKTYFAALAGNRRSVSKGKAPHIGIGLLRLRRIYELFLTELITDEMVIMAVLERTASQRSTKKRQDSRPEKGQERIVKGLEELKFVEGPR
ncbi:hypothetical protein L1987_63039 [Smallanthus sonchifolius]|uniref:Uncharacterized protein n=1 Tax=Smallanthus sonchifolius TaxID=185202 RepID=A0ACB9CC47_9ASTR|nr:hypothetical protein L1987_63039 [Smallanthus sonchifolius]